jgi:hypothetical protein
MNFEMPHLSWTFMTRAVATVLLLSSCSNNGTKVAYDETVPRDTVTVYVLSRVDNPADVGGREWMTFNPSTYRVAGDYVVEKIGTALLKHDKCAVLSLRDWECRNGDGAFRFGMRDGNFYNNPESEKYKVVSEAEWNRVNCDWQSMSNQGDTAAKLGSCATRSR